LEFGNRESRKKEVERSKKYKKGGGYSGGAATHGGRPPRRHPQPPTSPPEKMKREQREKRAFAIKNRKREKAEGKMRKNPHYSLFIGARHSCARGCTTFCVPSPPVRLDQDLRVPDVPILDQM